MVSAAKRIDLDSEVIQLSADNFHKTEEGFWLIKFYAPWCSHCKKMAPVYERLAAHYHRASNAGVSVGKVDGTEESALQTRFNVQGYPTIVLLHNGRKVADFSGKRTFDSIQAFVSKHTDSSAAKNSGSAATSAQPKVTSSSTSGSPPDAASASLSDAAERFMHRLVAFAEYDALTVGLMALGVGFSCSAFLMLSLCLVTAGNGRQEATR